MSVSAPAEQAGDALLSVRDLVISFRGEAGSVVRAVDGVSFAVPRGRTVGLVGESGCGKSVTSLAIMGLIGRQTGQVQGSIQLGGVELTSLSDKAKRRVRGRRIGMIFQEPQTSLNPVFTVGTQIGEAIRAHEKCDRKQVRERTIELLTRVGIPSPRERIDAYPHQLSGGMRQRVMIAIALAAEPELLIADEPTTALDVTIQAQILDLLTRLQSELGMSVLLITHDLGVVYEHTHHVVVMYAGQVVESASTSQLFRAPLHPYTQGLLASMPNYGDNIRRQRLPTISGMVPDLTQLPRGCRFQDRCDRVDPACRADPPPLRSLGERQLVRCIHAGPGLVEEGT